LRYQAEDQEGGEGGRGRLDVLAWTRMGVRRNELG